ncbi:MAG TPA: ATP-binding protein [Gaiellaceae bacterium]|jgi:signal transduction histidine kinase/ActR/RegA family two-component response regulator|nr:ATP-binding protein [Gaiellaceae bacterium]
MGVVGRRRGRGLPLAMYFLALIALAIVAAVAAAAYVSIQAHRDAEHGARANARFAADTAARRLGDAVASMRATIVGVAGTLEGQTLPATFTSACSLSYSGSDAFPRGHVDILAPSGTVVCSSRPARGGKPPKGYAGAGWLAAAGTRPLFRAPLVDAATGQAAVLASAPLAHSGAVVAFADLALSARSLGQLYGGGHPAEFLIMAANGRTIISRSVAPGTWGGRTLTAAQAPRTGDHDDVDGTARIYEAAPVAGTGWRLFVGEDRAAALATGISLRDRELWIIGIGLALVVLAAFAIYRRVAVPVTRLAGAVRAADPQSGRPVPVAGPAEVAGLATDINGLIDTVQRELVERQALEEQLRHAQKMDALGRVVAGVAHDFNNLVTVIGGFTGLILKRVGRDDPLRDHAEEVSRASERARVLLRQLLVFSRKESASPVLVELNDVIMEMRSMLGRILGPNVVLVAEPTTAAIPVRADRGQLEQVVMNLAVNARDAMPDGGRLVIRIETTTVDDHAEIAPGEYAAVSFSDTGTGMTEAVRERLFEPFFTTKEPGKGTGLGLATCYGIVSQAGGKIDVTSAPGRGSTFTVYLPVEEERAGAEPVAATRPGRDGKGETILLVEDDDGLRNLTKIVLEDAGYHVLDAETAEAALGVAAGQPKPIDLLLTDGLMGSMTGRELIERFAVDQPQARVIYMSGWEPESAPPGALPANETFLAKPFTPEALLEAVRNELDGGRSVSGSVAGS